MMSSRCHQSQPRWHADTPVNVSRGQPGTAERRLQAVGTARPPGAARSCPRAEDQPDLALEGRLPGLLAAAVRPARSCLTSHPVPATWKGARPGAVGAGAAPSTSGQHRRPPETANQTSRLKTGTARSVANLAPPLNHRGWCPVCRCKCPWLAVSHRAPTKRPTPAGAWKSGQNFSVFHSPSRQNA